MWNKPRRLPSGNTDAFTLVEILIAMAIVGFVIGAIYSVFLSTNRSYHTQDRVADAQQRVRVGIDFMVSDIRMAGFDSVGPASDAVESDGAGIKEATDTKIRFTSDMNMSGAIEVSSAVPNPERISYFYDPNDNKLKRITDEGVVGSESTQTLVKDVIANVSGQPLFIYRDADDNIMATPVAVTDLDDIRTVEIEMTVQGVDVRGVAFTRVLRTRVSCRNLGT